ncbi:MAG: chaperone modulator CbpM [Xanthomonadales bacterium]|nr:chaperone modulator CbpM [Xanthomonadales bacterium]
MAEHEFIRGQLIEEETVITVDELCRHCAVKVEEIITLVQEGILDPADEVVRADRAGNWQFHISCVRRVRTVVHLQRDLGVNLAGAALALELLDRIAELER